MALNLVRAGNRVACGLVLAVALCAFAQAQKINVQYDKSLDFSQFKTFSWAHHDAPNNPRLALAIAGAVEEELTKRGLKRVDENPDLYIKMYGAVDTDMSVAYIDPVYGSMPGIPSFDMSYTMWGYGMPGGTTSVTVHKGELVVDLIGVNQKRLVWRGVAKEKLHKEKEKVVKQVNTAVDKMFQQYPVKPR